MAEWLALYWSDIVGGFLFGALCSFVRAFWLRLIFSSVIFLVTYLLLLKLAAHAGFEWRNEVVGRAMLGVALGCSVRSLAVVFLHRTRFGK